MSEFNPDEVSSEQLNEEKGENETIKLPGRDLYKRLIAKVQENTGIELRPNHYSWSVMDWRRKLLKEIDGKRVEVDLRVGDQMNQSLFIYVSGNISKGRFQEKDICNRYTSIDLESHKDRISELALMVAGQSEEEIYKTYVKHQMETEVTINNEVFGEIEDKASELKSMLAEIGVTLEDLDDDPILSQVKAANPEEFEIRNNIVNQYLNEESTS